MNFDQNGEVVLVGDCYLDVGLLGAKTVLTAAKFEYQNLPIDSVKRKTYKSK